MDGPDGEILFLVCVLKTSVLWGNVLIMQVRAPLRAYARVQVLLLLLLASRSLTRSLAHSLAACACLGGVRSHRQVILVSLPAYRDDVKDLFALGGGGIQGELRRPGPAHCRAYRPLTPGAAAV
jgi:hypothetical protein